MKAKVRKVNWDKYSVLRGLNVTDGKDPVEYIRKSRSNERIAVSKNTNHRNCK